MQNNCSCNHNQISKEQLLQKINEVSFAVNDIHLYLDTHPCDMEAREYFNKHVKIRKNLLKEYARNYGPLTIDTAAESEEGKWQWVLQPWPWENGRGCR